MILPTSSPVAQNNLDRRERYAAQLYGRRYGQPLSTLRWRLEAHFAGDQEAVGKVRAVIPQLEAFGSKRGMTDQDMLTMISKVATYMEQPRTPAMQQQMAEKSFEAMRLDRGSTEAAQADVGKFNRFISDLRAEAPYVAELATTNGARVDKQFIEVGARYGAYDSK